MNTDYTDEKVLGRFAVKIMGHPDEIRAKKISLGRRMNTDYTDI